MWQSLLLLQMQGWVTFQVHADWFFREISAMSYQRASAHSGTYTYRSHGLSYTIACYMGNEQERTLSNRFQKISQKYRTWSKWPVRGWTENSRNNARHHSLPAHPHHGELVKVLGWKGCIGRLSEGNFAMITWSYGEWGSHSMMSKDPKCSLLL